MKLNKKSIVENKATWEKLGYSLPKYDREKVRKNTIENPNWIHFGAGNIFRAFQANVLNNLLNENKTDTGLIVAEGFDYEIIDKAFKSFDDLTIYMKLCCDGTVEKNIVGSIVESLRVDPENADYEVLKELFRKSSLQMVSFTITEKGYAVADGNGNIPAGIEADFKAGPYKATSYMGKVCAMLYERFKAGAVPLAMVSMDNCSHNGDKLKDAVRAFAKKWQENGVCDNGFLSYVEDDSKVSFPWSMIDKITPRPADSVMEMLIKDGIEEVDFVKTSKNTFVAPFVNAEEAEYLVIEDNFPNGRPKLEDGGVMFTKREVVDMVERMKVCTCLNPLHTTLAIYGCLLGYEKISDEMKDDELTKLIKIIGYKEGLPVVTNPGIINPKDFIDTVVEVRLPNLFMPDTPQRIACDTSQKLAIRFGETIKAYKNSDSLKVEDLKLIPLVFAGWARYLMGIDDNLNSFELSPDPMLEKMVPLVENIKIGDVDVHSKLEKLFSDASIFGVNLYEVGIGEQTEKYFVELIAGKGAIRETLRKYVGRNTDTIPPFDIRSNPGICSEKE
jgi:hypothetical protein|nr:mannitol dehydrogenase family protein [uncultured Lachnoanaerobaculum sp.]